MEWKLLNNIYHLEFIKAFQVCACVVCGGAVAAGIRPHSWFGCDDVGMCVSFLLINSSRNLYFLSIRLGRWARCVLRTLELGGREMSNEKSHNKKNVLALHLYVVGYMLSIWMVCCRPFFARSKCPLYRRHILRGCTQCLLNSFAYWWWLGYDETNTRNTLPNFMHAKSLLVQFIQL